MTSINEIMGDLEKDSEDESKVKDFAIHVKITLFIIKDWDGQLDGLIAFWGVLSKK
jgi:hypothetical protein